MTAEQGRDLLEILDDRQGRGSTIVTSRRLKLHPRKTVILPTVQPAPFLGFVPAADGGRRLPEDNIARFRNRRRGLRDRWHAGAVDCAEIEAKIGAWIAHAAHADTWRLRQAIFKGGWFDPGR